MGGGTRRDARSPMAWVVLFCAGLVEVAWAVGLKYTAGFTRLWPSALTVAGPCELLPARASREDPADRHRLCGLDRNRSRGHRGLGMVLFDEPRDWVRVGCIGLVVVGVIGLKLASPR